MRASLGGVAIVLAAWGGAPEYAQSPNADRPLVEWSDSRKLTVNDFRGRIPSRATEASRSWVAMEAIWECQEGKASSQVRAIFDPNRSWWRDAPANLWQSVDDALLSAPRDDGGRALLAHEQLHFDMTEVWARRIGDTFTTLPAFCKTAGGPRAFEKVVGNLERDWQAEQQRYDRETSHGADAARQRAWALKIAKTLQESYAAAAR